jgi:hypothetical protein
MRARKAVPSHVSQPPAQPNKQEPPIAEELGRFAFEPMAYELKRPPGCEHQERNEPQAAHECRHDQQQKRSRYERYPDPVAEAIDWVLMAALVLFDPFFPPSSS